MDGGRSFDAPDETAHQVVLLEHGTEYELGLGDLHDVSSRPRRLDDRLCCGGDRSFEDAGEHALKGVPDRWHMYRVVE